MKPQKNKIVFVLVLIGVVLFIVAYSIFTLGKDKKTELKPDRIPTPDLEENQKVYESKMEALDALKEERETTAPQVYPDHMVDDKGYFNPDYMEYEKHRIIDSVYSTGNLAPHREPVQPLKETLPSEPKTEPTQNKEPLSANPITISELALEQQLFFASQPKAPEGKTNPGILVEVDGKQVLRKNSRIRLRLVEPTLINGHHLPKYTTLFGTVRFRPNRTILNITQIDHVPLQWEAFDLQDGLAGLYLENSLREEASREVMDDMVQDINIAGLPQIRGLKSVFQRSQRKQKVTVLDGHRLRLKPKQ
ncbi:conjugative transposon protein TraM [Muricauda sp. 334s03]|uniref:Conjugative transposon protein TraM n=1 Tax=Flagellimonas yonaguniensis TaxID=3031325 RepID=A0ABT5XY83_9FLAO|nr:conjugative transposon protein TraM [[Muricauda] yonaguniensis]MDF0716084.1 conjugative transposon protein TraM [[Muricauda] yonaguniensis]